MPSLRNVIRFISIEIERKTDILAFAAFLMSLGSILIQLKYILQGSHLVLDSPKQVLITTDHSKNKHIRIAAKLIYFNEGSPEHHAIVKSEEAHIEFPGRTILLTGQNYIQSKENGNERPTIEIKSDADSIQVKSGDVVSHETYFVPFPSNTDSPNQNFVKFTEFVSLLEQNEQIDIRFISLDNKGKAREGICTLKTTFFKESFKRKEWTSTVCTNSSG